MDIFRKIFNCARGRGGRGIGREKEWIFGGAAFTLNARTDARLHIHTYPTCMHAA